LAVSGSSSDIRVGFFAGNAKAARRKKHFDGFAGRASFLKKVEATGRQWNFFWLG
jgi:hypothetical protein